MGNRVSTVSDVLTIRIGGEPLPAKGRRKEISNCIKSTKYTAITFVPQNLLEQFRRIANFYFLTMVVVSSLIESPVSPLTSLIPLVFVIAVTAAKQGYEDYLRYRADNVVNYAFVTVIRNGEQMNVRSQDIVLGDLVKAARDCDVPCDLVLLKTSDPHGKCHVTTANLDGETNLKTLSVPRGMPEIGVEKMHTLGTIECESARTDLYTFNGRVELAGNYQRSQGLTSALPLMAENLLLRGSRIKNTEWAVGCAVYIGQNTKLSLNSRLTRNKMSSSETYVNKFLIFFLLLLISWVICSFFLKRYFDLVDAHHNIYIGLPVERSPVASFLQDFCSFLILFNYLIPISLYVTIEMHKFLGSFFMEWDIELYDAETNQPCIVNTSDLNEELGQVKYLFSDKTGTLTKNEMILQGCSINGRIYTCVGSGIQEKQHANVKKMSEFDEAIMTFFQVLATCHTVQVAGDNIDDVLAEANTTDADGNQSEGFVMKPKEMSSMSEANNIMDQETLQKVTTFSNIREESESTHSITHAAPPSSFNTCEHTFHNDQTSSFASSNNGLIMHCSSCGLAVFRPRQRANNAPLSPRTSPIPSRIRLVRPLSTEFQRSISTNDELPNNRLTHRRTQSYAAPASLQQKSEASATRFADSVANMREFYAAPAFTESTLLNRKESMRITRAIRTAVQKLDYQASSPDEKALVEGCARVGILYLGETNDELTLTVKPFRGSLGTYKTSRSTLKFRRLCTVEFTSDRKRMSTIVRDPHGQIWLLVKGAESHILPLCTATDRQLLATTQEHINSFAETGLRTLAVARRKMTEEELAKYEDDLTEANQSLNDRSERIEAVNAKLEQNLVLVGATAVEDALQDNVRETLEALRYAGIYVWVLTGDKVETALNIALSCGHIPEDADKYFITQCDHPEQLSEHLDILENEIKDNPNTQFALLIDGQSLSIALKKCAVRFRDVAVRCQAVLCCRLSPLQKCEVVQLIKTCPDSPITAAIGDGANDVSMIQEAHVGLGIVGKEGRQAARCADFAFANFCMIKKVFLVHGYYYSHRLALLVLYFFYKNLVFMLLQFFFQMNSLFSSETLYDSLFLTMYNVLYTSLPVLFISLTEKAYTEQRLMSHPPLYTENAGNKRLYWKNFIGWMSLGLYHATVIYMSGYIVWSTNAAILPTPFTVNFYCFGTFMIHNVVVVVNLKLWLVAKYQSIWFIFTVIGSIVVFVMTTLIYNVLQTNFDGDMLYVYFTLLSSPSVWLLFLFVVVATLLPDYLIKSLNTMGYSLGNIFPGGDRVRAQKLFRYRRRIESTYL